MSNPNAPPPNPPLEIPHPPYHPPSSLAHELGVMFTFIALFLIILVSYYYAWLWNNEREAKAEWLRREKLAAMGIGVVPQIPRKRFAGGEGLLGTGGLGGKVIRDGGPRGWRERWRWSGMEREGKEGRWGGGMVMSTGAGHGGGEVP
ncbi:MAG: hypothetical protein LQ338_007587, partial [Usnochroma carphineum]